MIHFPDDIDLSQLSLATPTSKHGTYFSAIQHKTLPLFIQAPKCKGNQHDSKCLLDLTIDQPDLIAWVEALEESVQREILKHCSSWFVNPIDLDDIQSSFIPTLKRSQQQTILRCHCDNMRVYNEHKVETHEPIKGVYVVTILEFKGLSFTDKSFQLVVHAIQAMLLPASNLTFHTCMIKS